MYALRVQVTFNKYHTQIYKEGAPAIKGGANAPPPPLNEILHTHTHTHTQGWVLG